MLEFGHLRRAALEISDGEALLRSGVASDTRLSVRAIIYLIAGHADHHLAALRER